MITWDDPTRRYYQQGLDHGVLYIAGLAAPIPWNGLISVDEGGEGSTEMLYRDGIVYLADAEPGDHVTSITSMMYPNDFGECIGIPKVTDGLFIDNQKPKRFDLSYRSLVGSGSAGDMFGYQLHLLYNCMATIKQRKRNTIGKDTSPMNFEFDVVCTPVKLPGYRPSAHIIIDTRGLSVSTIAEVEGVLYGVGAVPGRMPTPTELFDLMNFGDAITVTKHVAHNIGSVYPVSITTYTVEGSSDNVYETDSNGFKVDNANAVNNGDGTWTVSDGGTTDVIIE